MMVPSDLAGLFRLLSFGACSYRRTGAHFAGTCAVKAKETRSRLHIQLVFRRTPGDKMGMECRGFRRSKGPQTMSLAMLDRGSSASRLTGLDARLMIRRNEFGGPTSGLAPGYVQGNLAILPNALA